MHCDIQPFAEYAVTPFVGVWIETRNLNRFKQAAAVTPFVGVWIETWHTAQSSQSRERHTLRGCVD